MCLTCCSVDDVFEFLSAVGRAHDLQALVVMLCVLLSCPLPCGVPLNLLLEIMHYIYAPPPLSEETPSVFSATETSSKPSSPSSPHVDLYSSPPLLKRSVASPFRSADPVTHESPFNNVSRVLPFGNEDPSSQAADPLHHSHRSVLFLITAACIKPILAATFVATAPSLSLASVHVSRLLYLMKQYLHVTLNHQICGGCQRFLMRHLIDVHPFFSAVHQSLQGVLDLCRSVITTVSRRNK